MRPPTPAREPTKTQITDLPACAPANPSSTPDDKRIVVAGSAAGDAVVAEVVKGLVVSIPAAITAAREVFALLGRAIDALTPVLKELLLICENFPPALRSALLTLAQAGWYYDPDIGLQKLWRVKALLEAGAHGKVDALMAKHFERTLPAVEEVAVAAFPEREKVIRSAIWAHQQGRYELAIPALLPVCDWASKSVIGKSHFTKDEKTAVPTQEMARPAGRNSVRDAWLAPLGETDPLNAKPWHRKRALREQGKATWTHLNRHLVLHGESADFDTANNSLKILSMLKYLAEVKRAKDERPQAIAAQDGLALIERTWALRAGETRRE